jgi:copper(I)-binding protein
MGVIACGVALALAASDVAAIFIVTEPWVRVGPNGRTAEGYMELTSTEGATIVGVKSEITPEVALRQGGSTHAMSPRIELPPGALVKLAPGVQRLVLTKLNRTLALGDRVGFVFTVESSNGERQDIAVSAEVRRHSPYDDHLHAHKH